MSLQAGIVGLPNVGKSTLFNSLIKTSNAQVGNFPFCTIEPNLGVITISDQRLRKLAEIVKPQKVIPNTVEIYDIAGLVKGASKGEGLGNQFLSKIRAVHTIIHVVRCFEDKNISHVHGDIDPIRDKEIIDSELQIKDLESIDKLVEKTKKGLLSGSKQAKENMSILEEVKGHISKGNNLRDLDEEIKAKEIVSTLLTIKPVIYVCNVDDKSIKDGNKLSKCFIESIKKRGEHSPILLLSSQLESEIAMLESDEQRQMFLDEYEITELGSEKLIRETFNMLGLQTFYTAGEKEVRAWTIKQGSKAPEAAGVIHTDFEKGFIRAEVISYKDYITYESELACREKGKLNVQGKNYVVSDGDIMHFRFNV